MFFLYGGGVVLNDVFDYELDIIERPERPLPQKIITLNVARVFGFGLLFIGVAVSFWASRLSGSIAIGIAVMAVFYDWKAKHSSILGPIAMGLCRAGNLLLGISIMPEVMGLKWFYIIIPLVYIIAVTRISAGEVHGNTKGNLVLPISIYLLVYGIIGHSLVKYSESIFLNFIFLLGFIAFTGIPLARAFRKPLPKHIGKAVKYGVLGLILMNASISVAFAGWWYGLFLVMLLPISLLMAKVFSVT